MRGQCSVGERAGSADAIVDTRTRVIPGPCAAACGRLAQAPACTAQGSGRHCAVPAFPSMIQPMRDAQGRGAAPAARLTS